MLNILYIKEITIFRLKYLLSNWKLIIHLLFRTYRFGVDNQWTSEFDSIFGVPFNQRWKLIKRYREMRMRAFMGFIPIEDACRMFPRYDRKNNYVVRGGKGGVR